MKEEKSSNKNKFVFFFYSTAIQHKHTYKQNRSSMVGGGKMQPIRQIKSVLFSSSWVQAEFITELALIEVL